MNGYMVGFNLARYYFEDNISYLASSSDVSRVHRLKHLAFVMWTTCSRAASLAFTWLELVSAIIIRWRHFTPPAPQISDICLYINPIEGRQPVLEVLYFPPSLTIIFKNWINWVIYRRLLVQPMSIRLWWAQWVVCCRCWYIYIFP